MKLVELTQLSLQNRASDLHLSTGSPPILRIDGELCRLPLPILTQENLNELFYPLMNTAQIKIFESNQQIDLSYEIPNLSRLRINLFYHRQGIAGALRLIPQNIPTLSSLQLPEILKTIAQSQQGLVLVTGTTGSGKSTTLAAMIHFINENYPQHIITLEDPIEFIHSHQRALIQQREIKNHVENFNDALRATLREDPDIILIGELRDLETIRLALTAAETGHLVLASLHTASAAKTIHRMIDVFPSGEKAIVQSLLAESLEAIICQTLLKQKEGGRIAAMEIVRATPAIRNLIRENKISQIESLMQTGSAMGMQTLEQHKAALGICRDVACNVSTEKSQH